MESTKQFSQTVICPDRIKNKEESMDYEDVSSPAPLDLCLRHSNTTPNISYTNSSVSPYSCSPPRIPYDDRSHRGNSLGSSPRSNSSEELQELSSTTCDNFEGFSTKFPSPVPRSKATRPFKIFPKDPMSLPIGSTAIDVVLCKIGQDTTDAYTEFRNKMMKHVQAQHNTTTNKNMRRTSNSSQNAHISDPTYWEKRRKNNEAAKRSRDARRAKEDEIAIRCAFLEHEYIRMKHETVQLKHENVQLNYRLASLQAENERLRNLMYP